MSRLVMAVLLIGVVSAAVYYFVWKPTQEVPPVATEEVKIEEPVTKGKKKKNRYKNTLPAIDSLAIHKGERELLVFSHHQLARTYHVSLGPFPDGPKQCEGDGKTPEGIYYINAKNPASIYHKNLGVSYPNSEDVERARALGKRPGGDIKIHGLPAGYEGPKQKYLAKDWTAGCIALTNREIDDLYERVKVGSPVVITP